MSNGKTEWDQVVLVSEGVALEYVGASAAECRDVGVDVGDRAPKEAATHPRRMAILASEQAAVEVGLAESLNRLCWNDGLRRRLKTKRVSTSNTKRRTGEGHLHLPLPPHPCQGRRASYGKTT